MHVSPRIAIKDLNNNNNYGESTSLQPASKLKT